MFYYAISLRTTSFLMVNSSWTKNHVDSILRHSDSLLDAIHMLSPLFLIKFFAPRKGPQISKIVYPPCDTREMAKFPLTNRERVVLSVAQFRWQYLSTKYSKPSSNLWLLIQSRKRSCYAITCISSTPQETSGVYGERWSKNQTGSCWRKP